MLLPEFLRRKCPVACGKFERENPMLFARMRDV